MVVSAAQAQTFTAIFPRSARPIQPSNVRVVFEGVYRL